jgi:hypothetical protein
VAAVKHTHQCPGVFFELKWRQRAPTVTQDSAAKIEFNRGCDFDVHRKRRIDYFRLSKGRDTLSKARSLSRWDLLNFPVPLI